MPMTMGFMLKGSSAAGIQFVGGATANKVGGTTNTSTIALNSGLTGGTRASVQANDLVIAVFATGSNNQDRTLSITDGTNAYTLIGSELYSGTNTYSPNLRVCYKFMGSTPDTSTTFGASGNANEAAAMAVYVFSGVNQTTPLDVAVTTAEGNGTGADPASITPSTAGAYIVVVGATAHVLGVDTYTAPTGIVGFLSDSGDDTYDVSMGIGHKNDWTSGAFNCGAFTGVGNSGSSRYVAMTIALRPA